MNAGVVVPLAVFAAVVLIVALVSFVQLHDKESEVYGKGRQAELEHREAMRRLDDELKRLKAGLH